MELLRSLGLNEESARRVHQSIPVSGAALTNQEACLQLGAALLAAWDKGTTRIPKTPRRIALIGAAGSGKSIATAKWITIESLRHRHDCRIWCLDGIVANSAEFLSQHAELLGIPVETTWNPGLPPCSREFLDLPGWNPTDPDVSDRMANLLDRFETACREHKGKHQLKVQLLDFDNQNSLQFLSGDRKVHADSDFIASISRLGLAYALN
jgi:GTPase SAR1 family protein